MIIIFGTRPYGKVDEIPGLGFVATEFFHVYYVPLIPFRTRFIVRKDADGFYGGNLPLSFKSIFTGWFRAASVFALLIGVTIATINITNDRSPLTTRALWGAGIIVLGMIVMWINRKMFRTASYPRAVELAETLGMDPRLRIFIDLEYHQINQAEAERRLDSLGYAADELANLDDEIAKSGLNERHDFK
jgi:hypothetical protein